MEQTLSVVMNVELTDKKLSKIVEGHTVDEAVTLLITEELNGITAGAKVTVIDEDPTFPYQGVVGVVRGAVPGNFGHVDVEFPDGRKVPVQVNQLVPVQ